MMPFKHRKALPAFLAAALAALAGCASTPHEDKPETPPDPPETMLVNYHAKHGREPQLEDALARTWAIYRRDKLVLAKPHLLLREEDAAGHTTFVESFTWINHAAPDNAPKDVKVIWKELESLCEPRDGKKGIDGSEVETVVAH